MFPQTARSSNFSLWYLPTHLSWRYRRLCLFGTSCFHHRRIFIHQVFMHSQSSHVTVPRIRTLSSAMKFMCNAIVVSKRMHYRKRTTHCRARLTVISVGNVHIYTQSIVFISHIYALTEKTQEPVLELAQRQRRPKPHRKRFHLALDQKIEKWEDGGFRSKPVAQLCCNMAASPTIRERERLQQEFRQCCMVSLKSDKDDHKSAQLIGGMLEVDVFPVQPIGGNPGPAATNDHMN
jgi:hypothetical protein